MVPVKPARRLRLILQCHVFLLFCPVTLRFRVAKKAEPTFLVRMVKNRRQGFFRHRFLLCAGSFRDLFCFSCPVLCSAADTALLFSVRTDRSQDHIPFFFRKTAFSKNRLRCRTTGHIMRRTVPVRFRRTISTMECSSSNCGQFQKDGIWSRRIPGWLRNNNRRWRTP